MAVNQTLRCYHHSNCEDHPAVVRCSKCGKGLCRECADNLKSKQTGKILCVDCLNEENVNDAAWAEVKKSEIRKELIFIIVGFAIGLAVEIFLFIQALTSKSENEQFWLALWMMSLVFFLPTLLASFRTIIKQVMRIRWFGSNIIFAIINILIRWLYFDILCFASPIIFIWRVVRRAKDIKLLKNYVHYRFLEFQKNEKYAQLAASMTTRLTTEEFESKLRMEMATELEANKEETEKKIKEMAADYNKKCDEIEKELHDTAMQRDEANEKMLYYKSEYESKDKQLQRAKKQGRQESRSTDDVDDDIAA